MPSFSHLLLVLLIVFVMFGAGKLPKVMGDLGKGMRNFRDGLDGKDPAAPKQEVLPPEDKK